MLYVYIGEIPEGMQLARDMDSLFQYTTVSGTEIDNY